MRESVVAQIKRDFAGVSRDGGVSIREAGVIDDYGTEVERARARAQDDDTHWSQVDLHSLDPGGASLSFFDPIGFRYHYPAFMIFSIEHGWHCGPAFIDSNCLGCAVSHATPPADPSDGWFKFMLDKFALFSDAQRRCVARFLVLEAETEAKHSGDPDDAIAALNRYWLQFLPDGERKGLCSRWPKLAE